MRLYQIKIPFSLLIVFYCLPAALFAQEGDTAKIIYNPNDSLVSVKTSTRTGFPAGHLTEKKYKTRRWIIGTANVVGYGSALIALNNTWYKNFPREGLHSFDDSKEWLQMDKTGHVFSAYFEGKYSMDLWKWAGLERKKRIWIGGLSGAAYQTIIEFLDGTSAKWGWSWADFGANCIGSGLLIGQELAWDEQRIQLKLGYTREKYPSELTARVNELFGKSGPERFLKDYNGQTYWLSANIKSFFPGSKLPPWLNIAVGYGATGMLGGFDNTWTDAQGNHINRSDIKRQRQFYLSPDIDLTRIPTKSKALKVAFKVLNMVRVPLPALELTGGKVKFKGLSF